MGRDSLTYREVIRDEGLFPGSSHARGGVCRGRQLVSRRSSTFRRFGVVCSEADGGVAVQRDLRPQA